MYSTQNQNNDNAEIDQENYNSQQQFNFVSLQKLPTLKANFCYITPIQFPIEEIQYQNENIQNQYQNQKQKQKQKLIQFKQISSSQNFLVVQGIKVKWNSFIKMKQRNYLQDYQLIKKIGKGGFGVVSKVKNIYTQVIRAAKVIKKKQLKQQQHKKLLQQLTIMRQLDHPNIIKLYEVYNFQDQYALILQLTSGGQLLKRIRNKKLSQKNVKIYMSQIIKCLIYLHSQGIVHRDLKPQNMLFQCQGSNILKIIDFGIASRISKQILLTDRIGTPSYIAPEVIYKQYNQKCDVWSAGVIFYFMLTAKMPFNGKNQSQLLTSILRDDIDFEQITALNRFSQQCKDLLKLMLTKKLTQRPSAAQVYEHVWFKKQLTQQLKVPQNNRTVILKNIRRFKFKNKLQAVVYTFIACQLLSKQQKDLIINIFNEIDKNNNGVISVAQLKQALSKQKSISLQRIQHLLTLIDTNCSGQIQLTQFLVASLSNRQFLKYQYFQKAFAYFDTDHSGSINYQQVVQFLQNYQDSEQQIQKMFKQVDSNGDGQIDQEQFIKLFLNHIQTLKNIQSKKMISDISTCSNNDKFNDQILQNDK